MNSSKSPPPVVSHDPGDTLQIEYEQGEGPWTIEVGASSGKARSVLHKGERWIVGTAEDADLQLHDPSVSLRHCALDATGDGLAIVDLGSRNGVYIGNVKVATARLDAHCQAIVVGKTTLILRASARRARVSPAAIPGLIGNSEPMQRVAATIRKHAASRAPILLVGESGTGKDVAARAIHELSARQGEYIPINVSTVPENLADSEFFGHVRGAFTGASGNRQGAFMSAHRGTILLDEIAELPLHLQVKLLRVVEDGIIRPVGGTGSQVVDVRFVSATWVSLSERVAMGAFRFDLLQRLSTVVIELPPLRQRRSDIQALVAHWLKKHEPDIGWKMLTASASARLQEHDWPGNVRELWAVLYRACTNASGPEVDWPDVEEAIASGVIFGSRSRTGPGDLLTQCNGNVSMAARAAGLPRSTFRSRLVKARGG